MANSFFKVSANATFNVTGAAEASRKAERSYLFRVGAYARTTARRLLKKKKTKYSRPGDPPNSKTGDMRNGIAFRVQMQERNVIIGPERDTSKKNSLTLHEFGGTVRGKAGYVPIPNREIRQSQLVEGFPVLPSRQRAHSRVFLPAGRRVYKPRPYMAPALDKTLEQDQRKFWVGR